MMMWPGKVLSCGVMAFADGPGNKGSRRRDSATAGEHHIGPLAVVILARVHPADQVEVHLLGDCSGSSFEILIAGHRSLDRAGTARRCSSPAWGPSSQAGSIPHAC